MDDLTRKLISGTYEDFFEIITSFINNYGERTRFDELNCHQLRHQLWTKLFHQLADNNYLSAHHHCLMALRILSRDKTNLDELITVDTVQLILQNARLVKTCEQEQLFPSSNIMIESLKLLCNLLFNSTVVQNSALVVNSLPYLIKRIHNYTNDDPHEVKLFDIRILFLITALNVPTRNVVKNQLKGDVHLIHILKQLSKCSVQNVENLEEEDIILICEVLKVLFNLYIQSDDAEANQIEKNKELVFILHKLLIYKTTVKQDELESNIVNLLTVIPDNCYSSIVQPIQSESCEELYENMDVTAISVLLKFLDRRLSFETDLIENISPVVTALLRIIRTDRLIRKYVRLQVLPPLKDVMMRPEEGTSMRAKLCKLLTTPIIAVRDLVAEFLFILCKENVNRMVKYTGYGNAAGMFANKGLLGRNKPKIPYSSESEDSETEEYSKYKEQINPVTGCFEQPKPNPLEGMSEEQKEYEALKLVGLVDKLTREGVVHPCRIGEDGKPKPIEHVLELQDELSKQFKHEPESD